MQRPAGYGNAYADRRNGVIYAGQDWLSASHKGSVGHNVVDVSGWVAACLGLVVLARTSFD